ncbi:succinate-semialdehyde dehydrogenase / glutarate-semialdehyde dehydrogenase [Paracoccus alcaliphilus]|uniref:Succinate-semialdehyde dehydrogenase / glutarate-semialdehyde dehydrogenase n=1 Tax=Paracoccus alcaliphilus TaxID=34002 RepID=A0A1H8FYA3_9RHOB|nr:NAD-dependent succinate-semialdehyde dehydrogenase [Paracoccus alcaliphilus]WCR20260.1 NAD-dependent succinate-semialdehyde dehydrogenase [Paracoccus alcaliphilus]SEN36696.1 succinate-semialdehyde dehydrogenase / glutarate-semialdehyde dehydrogenase [Paracoccus alcaliphilus]
MYSQFGLFIDGGWTPGTQTAEVISPVTEKPLGAVPMATAEDTKAALDAAARALPRLREMGGFARADALHRAADEMIRRSDEAAAMITAETGKPIAQAGREWVLSCEQFRWFAEEARRIYGRVIDSRVPGGRFEVTREPVGIVGAFTAWNFPAALPARKLAPALAAGCPVVLRPSSQTPGVAMVMVDCLRAAGLPDGAVNLVVGATATTYAPIMADSRVRKVSLTGSTRIGQQMIRDAAETVKKVSMELGGNAPLIVYDDADLDAALDLTVPTKFANAGQVCVTPDRIFVHDSLHDAFVQGFVARTAGIKLGDGLDPDTGMGPLINGGRLSEIESIVADAVRGGATLAHGGQRPAHLNSGFFFEPTVLTDVTDDMKVFAGENFGPIAAITRFSTEDEVIHRANASDMGLSAYAFTRSPDRARRMVAALKAGMVGINSFALAASEAPFGGTNHSGMGREGGIEGIEDYLDTKLAQLVF